MAPCPVPQEEPGAAPTPGRGLRMAAQPNQSEQHTVKFTPYNHAPPTQHRRPHPAARTLLHAAEARVLLLEVGLASQRRAQRKQCPLLAILHLLQTTAAPPVMVFHAGAASAPGSSTNQSRCGASVLQRLMLPCVRLLQHYFWQQGQGGEHPNGCVTVKYTCIYSVHPMLCCTPGCA